MREAERLFGRQPRLKRHFENLKRALAARDAATVVELLPGFTRLYFRDPNSAVELANPNDLILSVRMREKLQWLHIAPKLTVVTGFSIQHPRFVTHKPVDEFLDLKIVELDAERFSVWDLLAAIGYTANLHLEPDAPRLRDLYSRFAEAFPDAASALVLEIGACLIESLERLFDELDGNAAEISGRGPQIVVLPHPQLIFSGSALETPIFRMPNHGVRIHFDAKITSVGSPKLRVIFALGNRTLKSLPAISCAQSGAKLLVNVGKETIAKIDAKRVLNRFAELSIEIYPTQDAVVFFDRTKIAHHKINQRYELSYSKLVMGGDLDGKKNAEFSNTFFEVDGINTHGATSAIRRFGLRRFLPYRSVILHPLDLRRVH